MASQAFPQQEKKTTTGMNKFTKLKIDKKCTRSWNNI